MPGAAPQIEVTKSASPAAYTDVGQAVTYTLTVRNTGNITLTNARVSDPLLGAGTLCTIARLNPGESDATCTGTYTVKQSDIDTGTITNTASVNATAARGTNPTDTGQLTINGPTREPGLTLNKIAIDTTFDSPSDTLRYEYVVGNTGNVTLTVPATVTDNLISPLTCPAWPAAGLAPNQTWTCTGEYETTQADVDAGSVTNIARATSGTPLGPLQTPNVPATVNAAQRSELTITKVFGSAAPLPIALNSVMTFKIVATNSGNVTQNSVFISDLNPAFAPASKSCGTLLPAATCELSGALTVDQDAVDAGAITNKASVRSDLVTTPVESSEVTVAIGQTSSLALSKSVTNADEDGSTTITTNDTLTYTVTATNSGNVRQTNVTVFDGMLTPDTEVCASVAPGASCVLTGTYVVQQSDADNGQIDNTATVKSTLIPAPISATLSTLLPQNNDLAITKSQTANADNDGSGTITVGDVLEYTIVATNTGTVTQRNVTIRDAKITPDEIICPAVPRNGTCRLIGSHTVTQADVDAGSIVNTASVRSNAVTTPVTTQVTTAISQQSSIGLIKSAPKLDDKNKNALPDAGETLVYSFTVTNLGNVTLTNVTVADERDGVVLSGNPIASLAPGASSTAIKGRYPLKQADINSGSISNSATVRGTPPIGPPVTDQSDNSSNTENDPTLFALQQASRLALTKEVTANKDEDKSGFVSPGDTLTYSVTAKNTGNTTLTNVQVADTKITPASKSCPSVAPGKACVLKGTYKVTKADLVAKNIENRATATSDQLVASVAVTNTIKVAPALLENQFTKTALDSNIKRGEKVAYVFELFDSPIIPATFVDRMPTGFAYVAGSARLNGAALNPDIDGQTLTFARLQPDAQDNYRLELTLVATAGVNTGPVTNVARLIDPLTGAVIASARSTITVTPEPVFDCGEIIGKVFDDRNGNGVQDASTSPYEPEQGLPGVRLATVNGLLVTTDKEGRYHIACADIPDKDIGSNFILKVDPRSLPSGYRFTTDNPRTVRLTRGKISKVNFGASITRVVRLDVNGKVFASGSNELGEGWQQGLQDLVGRLDEEQSTLRITYYRETESEALAKTRIAALKKAILQIWRRREGRYDLPIETRVIKGYKGAAK
jgi:uncharacterized repeat protein (TIGR01451 family)